MLHAVIRNALAAGATVANAAGAGDPGPLDRWSLWVGAAHGAPEIRAGAEAFGETFRTQPFDLSDERTLLPRLRAEAVFASRHAFSVDYFELRSGRAEEASQAFRFQGTDYTAGARVAGRVDADVATVAYRYWLGNGRTRLGLGAGVGFYRLDLGVSARASLAGESVEARGGYAENQLAPMLAAGLRHAVSDRVRLYADASGIRQAGGRLSGEIYSGSLGVEWFAWRHVGLALEYGAKRVRLVREGGSAQARVDFALDKPTLFLRARF